MPEIITTKNRNRVVVKKTGHPAAFRKIRCPVCRLGYGVQSNVDQGVYMCSRCKRQFATGNM